MVEKSHIYMYDAKINRKGGSHHLLISFLFTTSPYFWLEGRARMRSSDALLVRFELKRRDEEIRSQDSKCRI